MRRVEKPWGYELIWAEAPTYVGKILHINKGQSLSLQYHRVKDETVFVQTGTLLLELENDTGVIETLTLGPSESRRILPGRRHRMTGDTDVDILEASTNHLEDVIRLEDRYGRVK